MESLEFAKLLRERHVRVVYLSRANLVKSALGDWRRRFDGKGQFRLVESKQRGRNDTVASTASKVDMDSFTKVLKKMKDMEKDLQAKFNKLKLSDIPVHYLTYEQLQQQGAHTLLETALFPRLGLDPPYSYTPLPASEAFTKASPELMCDAVANYRKFCAGVLGRFPGLAKFFEPDECSSDRQTDHCCTPCVVPPRDSRERPKQPRPRQQTNQHQWPTTRQVLPPAFARRQRQQQPQGSFRRPMGDG